MNIDVIQRNFLEINIYLVFLVLLIVLDLLGLLGCVGDGPVEFEGVVAHHHLVEQLREQRQLEGALLVVVRPIGQINLQLKKQSIYSHLILQKFKFFPFPSNIFRFFFFFCSFFGRLDLNVHCAKPQSYPPPHPLVFN